MTAMPTTPPPADDATFVSNFLGTFAPNPLQPRYDALMVEHDGDRLAVLEALLAEGHDVRDDAWCELAGLDDEAIVVAVVERKLRIRGERSIPWPPSTTPPSCILHKEIDSGAFERAIALPDRADLDDIEAKLEAGFLWITVGKRT